ncbi:hypothetical protein DICVIV_03310 [Dictyocaulus viviparus]|uniref:Uncharacterized protein n=1 Tax=Dictyocaulus viviparus TaxID=29172 RepID=A0A0D8Y1H8_DICVI|nr:hypothetical protein DICVIV_03310 [Dictyocaulus viviparus]
MHLDNRDNQSRAAIHDSIHEKLENTSTQSPQRTYSNEEQLFMLYMKQNPQIISNLGVTCSWSTAQAMNELQNQRVELRLLDDNSSISSSSLRQSRYVKKSHIPAPGQLKQTKSEKQLFIGNFPTNQHPNMDKRIDSMIESEIKQLRRREEELLEFRRELGLPTLQEIMYNWKQGPEEKTIHSATSYGHPHEVGSPMNTL